MHDAVMNACGDAYALRMACDNCHACFEHHTLRGISHEGHHSPESATLRHGLLYRVLQIALRTVSTPLCMSASGSPCLKRMHET